MSVSAQLSVRRGREAVAFYSSAFGAKIVHQVGGTDEHPEIVAELALGDTSFWISDEAPQYGNFSPESLAGTTVKLLLSTDDPLGAQAKAVVLGAKEIAPVKQSHGWLVGKIVDPFGHIWEIGKPLGVWPPASRS
jgi:PhnB protein